MGGTSGDVNYHFTASSTNGDGYRVHTKFDAYNLYGKAKYTASDKTKLTFIVAGTHYYNDNAEGLNLTWLAAGPAPGEPRCPHLQRGAAHQPDDRRHVRADRARERQST